MKIMERLAAKIPGKFVYFGFKVKLETVTDKFKKLYRRLRSWAS